MDTPRMSRPRVRLVGGVCAGFAEHTGLPLPLVRTITVLLTACGGAGLFLYGWLWAATPVAVDPSGPLKRVLTRPRESPDGELRDWLFAGSPGASVDLAEELRRIAAVVEQEYAARIDVVAAGQSPGSVPDALLGAAREAMLNAARHAGGTVSVYLESSPGGVELTVTDRGPGLSLADIPADRMGVRESILARMRRIGGTAEIAPGPGGAGTEVRLFLPLTERARHGEH